MPGAWIRAVLVLTAALILSRPVPSGADQNATKKAEELCATSLYWENDMMGGTDQHYTNAVKGTCLSKDLRRYANSTLLPKRLAEPIQRISEELFSPGRWYNVGLSVGQDIYTPVNTRAEELQEDDRPYAGWAYVSLALHAKNATVLDTFETSLGVVGPDAGGETAQNTCHDLIGKFRSEGWEHELENEPGLMFTWQRSIRAWAWRLENGVGLDFIPHVGTCLGNVHTYANMGGEVRFGLRLPSDFGSPLIRPGGVVNTPSDEDDTRVSRRWGWHGFLGTDGRAVARNVFLDGNTWKQSHRVEKKHFVADVYGGLSLRIGAFSVTYTHAFRTEEFNGQKDGQIFGSVNVNWSSTCPSDWFKK